MAIIWRGFGIVVPIAVVLSGLILSIWHEDRRIVNYTYSGWTFFIAALVLLPIGIALFKPRRTQSEPDENGQVTVKVTKHDFFYIPIVVWSVLCGIASAYPAYTSCKSTKYCSVRKYTISKHWQQNAISISIILQKIHSNFTWAEKQDYIRPKQSPRGRTNTWSTRNQPYLQGLSMWRQKKQHWPFPQKP